MSDNVAKIFSQLIASRRLSQGSLQGCTPAEIDQARLHFGDELPAEFVRFLEISGHRAGKLFQGTAIYFPALLDLQSQAMQLLGESGGKLSLPAGAMVFLVHQGYEFCFFEPTMDDPPVFQYVEGGSEFSNPWPSFSSFLRAQVQSHLSVWSNLDA